MTPPAPRPATPSSGPVVLATLAALVLVLGGLGFAVLKATPGPSSATMDAPAIAPSVAGAPPTGRQAGREVSRSGQRSPVDPAWLARVSAATGIPTPALRAYAAAQLRLQAEQPTCRLAWNTLAGIGWVESHHGTIGGRVLGADGRSSPTILGPALDGRGPVAAIRATPDSTRWHGDPRWDHAVGPMQFLSSSWQRWGADGDRDGTADPRDLDDAALAAGRYLCADGHDLASADWGPAVRSYNHDDRYVAAVAAAANEYAGRAG